jgi:hypothetical protein
MPEPSLIAPSTRPTPRREIFQADALAWLAEHAPLSGASLITSLPDVSEVPTLGFDGWRAWFVDAAAAVLAATPEEGVAIFFQSDIRHEGLWIDKGHLVMRAADDAQVPLLFHRIVCRKPAGIPTAGRATFSHLLGFGRRVRPTGGHPTPDVLPDAGFMPTKKSMGVSACRAACRFVLDETTTRTVVDPFCGAGTVLAVANAMGLDAVGVDLALRQCRRARNLTLELA